MTVRISVAGAGLIGHRHAAAIAVAKGATLASVVDPSENGDKVAKQYGVTCYRSLTELFEKDKPDGVIVATPNQLHVDNAMECVAAGVPAIIEKPIAEDLDGAARIVEAGKSSGVALLTGHHRRHNALIARAKETIENGDLGQITAVQGTTWFRKPNDYYNVEWRTKKGGGPVLINMVHDIDLMRHLCGEIVSVHSMESNAARGFEAEDTAVVLLKFDNGALGTMTASDAIQSPWSWELTARENPMYPATNESCYLIGGTKASLSLPNLSVWGSPADEPNWWAPISETKMMFDFEDPLIRQIRQFAAVIRGDEEPLVPVEEGLKNQRVLQAIKTSAETGQTITLD